MPVIHKNNKILQQKSLQKRKAYLCISLSLSRKWPLQIVEIQVVISRNLTWQNRLRLRRNRRYYSTLCTSVQNRPEVFEFDWKEEMWHSVIKRNGRNYSTLCISVQNRPEVFEFDWKEGNVTFGDKISKRYSEVHIKNSDKCVKLWWFNTEMKAKTIFDSKLKIYINGDILMNIINHLIAYHIHQQKFILQTWSHFRIK